jgi:hypothetical protein
MILNMQYEVYETLIISLTQTVEADSPEEALEKNTIPYDVKGAIEKGYLEHPVGNPRLTTMSSRSRCRQVFEIKDGESIEVLEIDN